MQKKLILFLIAVIIAALSITAMAIDGSVVNNVQETHNVNFTQSYNVSSINGLLTRNYTPGGWFSKASASTEVYAFIAYENHALTAIEGSDLKCNFVDSETYVNGKVNSGTVHCSTKYAIYTDHFAEIWNGYDLLYYWDLEFYAN